MTSNGNGVIIITNANQPFTSFHFLDTMPFRKLKSDGPIKILKSWYTTMSSDAQMPLAFTPVSAKFNLERDKLTTLTKQALFLYFLANPHLKFQAVAETLKP